MNGECPLCKSIMIKTPIKGKCITSHDCIGCGYSFFKTSAIPISVLEYFWNTGEWIY